MTDFAPLYQRLHYRFKQIALLEAALTHRSLGEPHNERLEYLGDSLLNFIIAEKLYKECPQLTEGELSRLRATLVKGDTLTELAKELNLNEYLRLGSGEIKTGGAQRASILANVVEAVIGAVYLDAGFEVCQELVQNWFGSRITAAAAEGVQKDSKTQLQEYLQGHKLPLPEYTILSVEGEAHSQFFKVVCKVAGLPYSSVGEGTTRRKAEQIAAKNYLSLIQNNEK